MTEKDNQGKESKKPYHPPKLTEHGDLCELTEASGGGGQKDGYADVRTG